MATLKSGTTVGGFAALTDVVGSVLPQYFNSVNTVSAGNVLHTNDVGDLQWSPINNFLTGTGLYGFTMDRTDGGIDGFIDKWSMDIEGGSSTQFTGIYPAGTPSINAGEGMSDSVNGYGWLGGLFPPTAFVSPSGIGKVWRFPFSISSGGDFQEVKNLINHRYSHASHASPSLGYGYVAGGNKYTYPGDGSSTSSGDSSIEKFTFAVTGSASNIGNIGTPSSLAVSNGNDSTMVVHGFTGANGTRRAITLSTGSVNTVSVDLAYDAYQQYSATTNDKINDVGHFIVNTTSTTRMNAFSFNDISDLMYTGDLSQGLVSAAGHENDSYGFYSAGIAAPSIPTIPGSPQSTVVYRFPFSVVGGNTATSFANLTTGANSADVYGFTGS